MRQHVPSGNLFFVILRLDVLKLKVFFYFMYTDPPNQTIVATRFPEIRERDVKGILEEVIHALYKHHTPQHVNLGDQHKIDIEDLKENHSTFWSDVFGEDFLEEEEWVLFNGDGFYIECESFGGHHGQKELFSYKGWHLSKVQSSF